MMTKTTKTISRLCAVYFSLAAAPLFALPTFVVHQDIPECDPLSIPMLVDEVGDPLAGFPADESLRHEFIGETFIPVCLLTDDQTVPEAIVSITNVSGRDFDEVWYVADPETRISNFDGFANDAGVADGPTNFAFRIDNDVSDPGGSHHPLLSEDLTGDNIWEAGETWQFVLQDYSNALGISADAFTSTGVGDLSKDVPGLIASSGSIIAIPSSIPEPASGALALISFFAAAVMLRYRWG